jgi:hypothetical protein
LPSKRFVFKNEEGKGMKQNNDRVTLVMISNASGSEKRIIVIGKSKKPTCFKNAKLPLEYLNQANAWGNRDIFIEIIENLDRRMKKEKRKIVMFIDNCAPHLIENIYENVHLIFFPPNITSILQPLDQGIIHSFKSHYRNNLVSHMISILEKRSEVDEVVWETIRKKKDDEFNLLQAMILMKSALSCVSQTTIRNCFKKAFFDFPNLTATTSIEIA